MQSCFINAIFLALASSFVSSRGKPSLTRPLAVTEPLLLAFVFGRCSGGLPLLTTCVP